MTFSSVPFFFFFPPVKTLLFTLLIRPFCAFLMIPSSTSCASVQPPLPLCLRELPIANVSAADQEDNQLGNNMTAGGHYALPSAVTQKCVSRQTKTCFSLEEKTDWCVGKSVTIDFSFSDKSAFFFSNATFKHQTSSSCKLCSWWMCTDFVRLDQAFLWL